MSIYSKNSYLSYDLDFIELYSVSRKKLNSIMAEINFLEKNRYFVNKDSNYFVEFPSGPLSIGSEPVNKNK